MAIKLIKACKELNIGMATAVEFLAKQGMAIDTDPNLRIEDDIYMRLAKEFNKDMALKMEAERQQQQRQERDIQKVLTLDSAQAEADKKAAEAARKAAEEAAAAAKKAAEEAARKAQEEAQRAAEAARKAQEEAERIASERAAAEREAAEAARLAAEAEKAAKESKKEPAQAPVVEKKPVAEQPNEPKEKKKTEIFTLGKPVLKNKPKVVGKIDLDTLNQATHPRQKTKEEKKKEREEREQQRRAANAAAAGGEKRKRERIKQNKVDVNDVKNQKGGKNASKKKGVRVEIDDEEVQRQIKETIARLQGNKGKTATSKHKRERREQEREKMATAAAEEQAQSKVLKLTEFVTANDLAVMMNVPVTKIIGTCMSLGMMVSINQRLDAETINIVAEEFGFQTEYVSAQVAEKIAEEDEAYSEEDMEPRAPIVTVMGHVDHGKTSLLDHIRNTNVIAGEAGGITQHIGAYNVKLSETGKHITFLDTPGHEAFTAMRARGAQVTDIAIIIVAADDGVMPQTREAISHAQAAGVPMVFAINKCDKPGANPDKIKEELANMNLLVEEWGGKYQSQDISAKKGTGVHELLDKVLLEAELLDLKANPKRRAKGSVIESSLDKGRGYVATVLVSDGTLHMGDVLLAGTFHGKVKAMFNERGQRIQAAKPGEPAVVLGLNGAPQAGDEFNVLPTEQEAKDIASKREQLQREQSIRTKKHVGLEEIGRRLAIGVFKELNLIIKADVDGSTEALADSMIKLSTENIQVNVIHKSVGAISDSDV
ncbi:MAG: translation initiation factor IF-2, partial [Paludibacteraceae bacterium]|nr:translation initiation factor IF-2 [Paludibacteraceae bacterium]